MTTAQFRRLQERAQRTLRMHADDYAETLVLCAGNEYALCEVECVLALCGLTAAKFMMAWAKGAYDA